MSIVDQHSKLLPLHSKRVQDTYGFDISYPKTSRASDTLISSGVPALSQPCIIASMLPLLLGIHLELITALDYS